MTPKEKAKDLLCDFAHILRDNGNYSEVAKQCALIASDEIIRILKVVNNNNPNEYWQKVKKEIEL